ncbi:MAG: four helix bundle protein [Polyangiaceae bacterium]
MLVPASLSHRFAGTFGFLKFNASKNLLVDGAKGGFSMQTFHFQNLDVYAAAKDFAVLVQQARIKDVELRNQATRAAKSCFLNLAEGLPSKQAGIRRRHFAIAYGSLGEVCAAIDLANALGAIEIPDVEPLQLLAKKLAMLMSGLTRNG